MNKITIIDFSHLCMRMLHISVLETNPKVKDGLFITKEYESYFKHLIFNSISIIKSKLGGEIVIAMDSKGNWRKDIYPDYKGQRKKVKDDSKINYKDFYGIVNDISEVMIESFPFKVLKVDKAEADDIAGVIAQRFGNEIDITLVTSDKDWFQVMVENPKVKVYDPMKREFKKLDEFDCKILNTKWGDISRFTLRHALKGDTGDNIKKINKDTVFSPKFLGYLKDNDCKIKEVKEFNHFENRGMLLENFNTFKKVTSGKLKGKDSKVKDVYKDVRLMGVEKIIEDENSLETYINSHELYEERLELNLNLVDFNRIPQYLKDNIVKDFKETKVTYNPEKIKEYFIDEGLADLARKANSFFDSRFEIEYTTYDDFEF